MLVAGFVNYSAVCEQLRQDARPIHIVCAGTEGEVTSGGHASCWRLGGVPVRDGEVRLNDSARLAWDCFENHGRVLLGALEVSRGGAKLRRWAMMRTSAPPPRWTSSPWCPRLRRDPLRIEVGPVGIGKSHWSK